MQKITSTKNLMSVVFKAIALAMSVAVVITNIMSVMGETTQIVLLGIGLFCLTMVSIEKE